MYRLFENKPTVMEGSRKRNERFSVLNIKEKYRSRVEAILQHDYETISKFGHHVMETVEGDIVVLAHGSVVHGPELVFAGKYYTADVALNYIKKHITGKKIILVSCYCGKIIKDIGEETIVPVFDTDTTISRNGRFIASNRMNEHGEHYFEFILENPSI